MTPPVAPPPTRAVDSPRVRACYPAGMDAASLGTLLGGIGLFLLGMSLMTDSLSALGGRSLRAVMRRLIHRRSTALVTGALVTALLQSSSATTLVTVGFVSAGLVTFSESLGLILGANIGTTSTGWIVSTVGLKFKVSAVALPLVGVGALIRLVTRGRRARLGLALSGFGLVFVGIDVMQQGMATANLDMSCGQDLPGPVRVAVLVLVGGVMTVVMQSSSAAIATTLVALNAGSLALEQAAVLVIGQNVGTTVTAILGALGGSLSARRTAVAHTLFNLITALVALALLGPFLALVTEIGRRWVYDTPETAVALFHTAFNLLGVLLVYPWLGRFARLVERIVPRPKETIVIDLPRAALSVPAVALQAARNGAATATLEALRVALVALRGRDRDAPEARRITRALALLRDPKQLLQGEDDGAEALAKRIRGVETLLSDLETYLGQVQTSRNRGEVQAEHIELLHALDHLRRLLSVAQSQERRGLARDEPELRALADPILEALDGLVEDIHEASPAWLDRAAPIARACAVADRNRREAHRDDVMRRIAAGEIDAAYATRLLAASRWIGKTPKHAASALKHLATLTGEPEQASAQTVLE